MMRRMEKQIEAYFIRSVSQRLNGRAYKFVSPANRGVADRIVCLPDGSTWFVELKAPGGRLSPLQGVFADEMRALQQNYTVLWSKEQVDKWITEREYGFAA